MWIVDESAAFQSGYLEISNRTIETDTNVILSETRYVKHHKSLRRNVKRMTCIDNEGRYWLQ